MLGRRLPRSRADQTIRASLLAAALAAALAGCGDYCEDLCHGDRPIPRNGQCFCERPGGDVYGPVD